MLWETTFAISSAIMLLSAAQYLWGSSGVLIVQIIFQVLAISFLLTWETAFVHRPPNVAEDTAFFSWLALFAIYNVLAAIITADMMQGREFPREHVVLQFALQLLSFVPLVVFRIMREKRRDQLPVQEYEQITQIQA